MQRYFDAIEGGNGGALFDCCSADAQLFDTESNVFMDFSKLATAEATAADLASKMGPCQLRYTVVSRDTEGLVEVHDVDVYPEGGADTDGVSPAVQVRVKVTLTMDAESGKVTKAVEEEVPIATRFPDDAPIAPTE